MSCKISRLCLISVILFDFVECHVRVRKFVKSQAVFDRTRYSKSQSTRSKIDCGTTCAQEDFCQKFSYTNNMCLMGESAVGSGVMYKSYDGCPAKRGYSLWVYADVQLCLKYNSKRMEQVEATSICENDGGHLVLAESLAANLRINDSLTELAVTKGIWLDGHDASSTNQFLSWKGQPLAWIEWGFDEPDDTPGHDCLFGIPSEGYKHRDAACFHLKTVVCQKDML